jgi:endonuclease/exonuclease/phosphatase family metal-dependent hydrolase
MRSLLLTFLFLITLQVSAQETYKLMFYNILNYPSSDDTKADTLKKIIDYTTPDLLMLTEITDGSAVNLILNNALNTNNANNWSSSPFIDGPDTDNLLFYKNNLFGLLETNVISTNLRDINEYVLFLKASVNTDTTYMYVYVAHLKAGSEESNASKRTLEVTALKNYIDTRTKGEHFIASGDFNIYDADENAYQALLNYKLPLIDPIDQEGEWHNNSFYSDIHTQSTRTDNLPDGGSIGGMDDRFDFILISDDLLDGPLSYVQDSYESFGQDGEHFNESYFGVANEVVPDYINTALYYMSDHLPVTMELFYESETNSIDQDLIKKESKLLHIKDIMGRKTSQKNNCVQFYIYENGGIEKKIVIN